MTGPPVLRAVVVPSAPLLVPELAGGSAELDTGLRAAVRAAVAWLVGAAPGEVVVVGSAPGTGPVRGGWDWSPFGLARRAPGEPDRPALPTPLAIGDRFLDEPAGPGGRVPRRHLGVAAGEPPQACRELGAALVRDGVTGLLVVGDGSACGSEKAPGHLDPDAAPFDAGWVAALRAGDPAGLLAVAPERAARLLADGRAAWQVLAGAAEAAAGPVTAQLDHDDAPYGVRYAVARWTVPVLGER